MKVFTPFVSKMMVNENVSCSRLMRSGEWKILPKVYNTVSQAVIWSRFLMQF